MTTSIVTVGGQLGVTTCTFATQANCPNFLRNSYCDLNSLTCECPTAGGYVDDGTGVACTYDCGSLTAPINGSVDTSGGTHTNNVATYSCNNGYKVVGEKTATCVQDTGWDNTAATCEAGVVGDDCSSNIFLCFNIANGICKNFDTCQCQAGYEQNDNGAACTEIDECIVYTPCQNNGTCTDAVNSYTCTCIIPGTTGQNCETNIDECASAPCQSGSTCYDEINGYHCTCLAGYEGVNCETNTDECTSNPCRNGATCEDAVNSYVCVCTAGFNGVSCENNINECAGNQYCQNGATCLDGISRFTCFCAAGFTGYYCENAFTDMCARSPCQNDGVCIETSDDFFCHCAAGYYGKTCALKSECIDEQPIIIVGIVMAVAVVILTLYAFYITLLLKRKISKERKYQSDSGPGNSSYQCQTISNSAFVADKEDNVTTSPVTEAVDEALASANPYTNLGERDSEPLYAVGEL